MKNQEQPLNPLSREEVHRGENARPKGIVILERTKNWVVALKPAGVSSEADGMGRLLAEALGLPAERIYPVHRLDKEVGGVMVYALEKKTAAFLSQASADGRMRKIYLAAVQGIPDTPEGRWENLLYHDVRRNKTYVVDRMRKGVKPAALNYRVLKTISAPDQLGGAAGPVSLLEIRLETGRTHQIRVQCASRRMPLLHDRRYGGTGKGEIGLHAWKLTFPDPVTGEEKSYLSPAHIDMPGFSLI